MDGVVGSQAHNSIPLIIQQKEGSMSNQQKRGPGRPRVGSGSEHIDLTLPHEMVGFLRSMPAGQRSKFVRESIEQNVRYKPLPENGLSESTRQ